MDNEKCYIENLDLTSFVCWWPNVVKIQRQTMTQTLYNDFQCCLVVARSGSGRSKTKKTVICYLILYLHPVSSSYHYNRDQHPHPLITIKNIIPFDTRVQNSVQFSFFTSILIGEFNFNYLVGLILFLSFFDSIKIQQNVSFKNIIDTKYFVLFDGKPSDNLAANSCSK